MDYTTLEMDRTTIMEREFVSSTYGWMTAGLALTGLISTYMASNAQIMAFMFAHPWVIFVCFIAQIAMVFGISGRSISGNASMITFVIYSIITGVVFSTIFLTYAKAVIAKAFFSTAGMFGFMAVYGHTTKKDLTAVGSIGMMALVGIIIAMIVNMFLRSPMVDLVISVIGVIVFAGLTAFDAQKIKQIAHSNMETTNDQMLKFSIIGALTLYLDFINMFLFLLSILSRRD